MLKPGDIFIKTNVDDGKEVFEVVKDSRESTFYYMARMIGVLFRDRGHSDVEEFVRRGQYDSIKEALRCLEYYRVRRLYEKKLRT